MTTEPEIDEGRHGTRSAAGGASGAEPTIREVLAAASVKLESVSESARLDAELLLARAIDMPRSFLFAHADDTLDAASVERLETALARRAGGEPLAYICGTKEFWSLELMVTPDTLVPRPETELLVEQALGWLPRRAEASVVDLGTGSGAIAIAIARERPLCRVTATDVSAAALAVAAQNARALDLSNIEFIEGDWTAPLAGRKFDVLVSNPPYVADDDPALDALHSEPRGALAAGSDGLDDIRRLAVECLAIAAADAVLLLEHGADQEHGVAAVLADSGWRDIRCHRDYAGKPRITLARAPAGTGSD